MLPLHRPFRQWLAFLSCGPFAKMVDATRALLDQLMGKDRNMTSDERHKKRRNYWDEGICQW